MTIWKPNSAMRWASRLQWPSKVRQSLRIPDYRTSTYNAEAARLRGSCHRARTLLLRPARDGELCSWHASRRLRCNCYAVVARAARAATVHPHTAGSLR